MADRALFFFVSRALLFVLLVPLPASAAPVSYGDVSVALVAEPVGAATHGYGEYRIQITNRSSDQAHTVTLTAPGDSFPVRFESTLRSVRRSVEVAPKASVTVQLLFPVRPAMYGNGLAVRIDGQDKEERVPVASFGPGGRRGMPAFAGYGGFGGPGGIEPLVLVSQSIPEAFFRRTFDPRAVIHAAGWGGALTPPGTVPAGAGTAVVVLGATLLASAGAEQALEEGFWLPALGGGGLAAGGLGGRGIPGMPARGVPGGPAGAAPGAGAAGGGGAALLGPIVSPTVHAQLLRADMPVALWGTAWLGYTRYDGIAVTADDLDGLRRGGRDARAVLTALWQYVEAGGALFVAGPGSPALPASWQRSAAKVARFTAYRPGFGECLVSADRDQDAWEETSWKALNASWSRSALPWHVSRTLTDANRAFPVVDDLGTPVFGLLVLMILFAAAIGPLNLWFLDRRKKRIWMLWTVPVLSAFTCLLVLGYMVAAEGWSGRARVEAFTVLDESERRAATLGRNAFYSPLTPSSGLVFSTETEVSVQSDSSPGHFYPHRGGGGNTASCTLDWGAEQHLARGWVAARVPAHFLLRKSEHRRERLTFAREGGSLTVVNGLGAAIESLWVADEQGNLHTSGPIPAGDRVALERAGQKIAGPSSEALRKLYGAPDWTAALNSALKNPEALLGPRSYLAVLDSSPFLETGLRRAKLREARGVVLGLMGEQADAR
jgi:hypothetical protein